MASPSDSQPTLIEETKSSDASPSSSSADTNGSGPVDQPASLPSPDTNKPRIPTLKPLSTESSSTANMTPSSTVAGTLEMGRRPGPLPQKGRASAPSFNSDIAAKMAAFQASRRGTPVQRPQPATTASTGHGIPGAPGGVPPRGLPGGVPANFVMPNNMRPQPPHAVSAPSIPKAPAKGMGGMKRRGPQLNLADMHGPSTAADGQQKANGQNGAAPSATKPSSLFDTYSKFVDTKKGTLILDKATLSSDGINFGNGKQFNISLDEVDTLDELGKGNYGTVYKVRHSRPRHRKVGQGLAGNKASASPLTPISSDSSPINGDKTTTGIVMAMKEIRLELDESKFAQIIMELDILHRCISPYIIDFYGAFFQEGAVYICIEFMDGGSIDKIYGGGVPEGVLRKITYATTRGLRELKDVHNIIHRDVKPTNILVNTRGQVKICDFGVSGNLVASIARTNIGCQSYMAPERISGGGISAAGAPGGTYSVQSDIWSLGLSIIECALGRYPYPPETHNNIFSQLSAIVDGEPPDLPTEGYSIEARDFVHGCLNKIPKLRPTYAMLLAHPWLAAVAKPSTITEEDEELAEKAAELGINDATTPQGSMGDGIGGENKYDKEVAEWCMAALERKRSGKMGIAAKPALHAAPLDSVSPAASPAAAA